jgi:hypothetical protein
MVGDIYIYNSSKITPIELQETLKLIAEITGNEDEELSNRIDSPAFKRSIFSTFFL